MGDWSTLSCRDAEGQQEYELDAPLQGQIAPDRSKYTILSTKLEIRLAKAHPGHWPDLTPSGDSQPPNKVPAYPTSKRCGPHMPQACHGGCTGWHAERPGMVHFTMGMARCHCALYGRGLVPPAAQCCMQATPFVHAACLCACDAACAALRV